jgi:hypothetical protein
MQGRTIRRPCSSLAEQSGNPYDGHTRRSAVEPVIGHVKAEHRMERNYLACRAGDAANPILAAVGYNLRRLIAGLAALACILRLASQAAYSLRGAPINLQIAWSALFAGHCRTN